MQFSVEKSLLGIRACKSVVMPGVQHILAHFKVVLMIYRFFVGSYVLKNVVVGDISD